MYKIHRMGLICDQPRGACFKTPKDASAYSHLPSDEEDSEPALNLIQGEGDKFKSTDSEG